MTGSEVPGKASIGSWLAYGLGSESNDLPAFVVFTPRFPSSGNGQALFTRMWAAASCPTRFNGVALRGTGDPVLYLQNPPGVAGDDRRAMLDALDKLNQRNFERFGDPETQTRIAQYEMAFRMQTSVPELVDLRSEPQAHARPVRPRREQARHLRRTARCSPAGWSSAACASCRSCTAAGTSTATCPIALSNQCDDTDQRHRRPGHGPQAARPARRHARRLGRRVRPHGLFAGHARPTTNYGRDHHPRNFCMWLAGGGIKGGIDLRRDRRLQLQHRREARATCTT